ncbi:hypothetical protein ARMGADRAFT_1030294 [Armillaria gallica]|uniref:Uncharacterized protein n=1 Tax=Armillaria gallica TaxID=47427 RepID=A0A2H3DIP7_ARMGA|nr:hypothetical protein ARMGADRAFT_1030294 [Armillaria gallica]
MTLEGYEGKNVYIPFEYLEEILPFIASLDLNETETNMYWAAFSGDIGDLMVSLVWAIILGGIAGVVMFPHSDIATSRLKLQRRCGLVIHTGWYKLTDNEQRIIEATSPVLMHSQNREISEKNEEDFKKGSLRKRSQYLRHLHVNISEDLIQKAVKMGWLFENDVRARHLENIKRAQKTATYKWRKSEGTLSSTYYWRWVPKLTGSKRARWKSVRK